MDYIKVTFRIDSSDNMVNNILIAYLSEIYFESFEETTQGVIAYCQAQLYNEDEMKIILNQLPFNKQISYRIEKIADQNWNQEWEEHHFEPIYIEDCCCVHSAKRSPEKQYPYDIIINPRQAFGTGSHETTRLILSLLLHMDLKELDVIDMGCGTGVLSIMAAKRGAKQVIAIDIDPWSQQNSIDNITINHCEGIKVLLGDSNQLDKLHCDLFLANINRNILLNDMKYYAPCVNTHGQLIISGFYNEDLPVLEQKANEFNFKLVQKKEDNNWVAALFQKL